MIRVNGKLKHTEEEIEKMRLFKINYYNEYPEAKEKIRLSMTLEAKEKRIKALRTPEARERMKKVLSTPEVREKRRKAALNPIVREKRIKTLRTPEARERMKKSINNYISRIGENEYNKRMKNYRMKQIFPIKDTSIELKIQNFLKELKMDFFTHNYMRIPEAFQCDILIPTLNLIIECDGDFFHCNPKFYSAEFIRFPNGHDKRNAKMIWERDKLRVDQLLEKGFKVLRLWENEIHKMTLNDFRERLLGKEKVIA
jgi:G:T-mismatch repair DNA endonuclease (very short patch repair protein)